jgi:selenide, water dikinase
VHELASSSRVRAILDAAALPALPDALELAARGVRTGGDRRNREFAAEHLESDADAAVEALAFDPQTAGGLLVSVPTERAAVLDATLRDAGLLGSRIGRIEEGAGVVLR